MREQPSQRARVEPAPARREKERVLGAAGELGARLADVARDHARRLLAEWDDTLLAALAADVDELLLEVDVGEVEVDRLLRTQARRVDELREREVPQRQRAGACERRQL